MKLTIIPDVHGRPFWRDAVKDVEDTPVIFLGDYLDPYPQDMVTWEDALQGLHDIIELKKRNPEQVTLLLGNHDVHYFESYPFFSRGGRMNHEHFEEIRDIFMENLALFDLAKCISCDNGLPYLFTHAGVRTRWIEANVRYIERNHPELYWYARKCENECRTPEGLADYLNSAIHDTDAQIFDMTVWSLGDVSSSRGGRGQGSCVWADIRDFTGWNADTALEGCWQICGHTRQDSLYLFRESREEMYPVTCVDFGRAILLDTDTGSLQAKMERKDSFHFSDISCLSLFNIFDLNIWNLSDQAREQAKSIIADALSKGLILRFEDRDAYYFPVAKSLYDDKICEWAVDDYESYLRGEHRYM